MAKCVDESVVGNMDAARFLRENRIIPKAQAADSFVERIRAMAKVLGIFGAGGLGKEVFELSKIINAAKGYWHDIVFLVDVDAPATIDSAPVFEFPSFIEKCDNDLEVAIAIGEPAFRETVFNRLKENDVKLATIIHPSVHIPDTTVVGEGAIICIGSFVSCHVSIGDNVLIQPHANIGHDCVIGDGCVISSSCNIGGSVNIGSNSYLGLSVAVKEGARIGSWSIVGMSSSVIRDIPDEVIALGNPARAMKNNEEHRVFG